MTDAEKLDRLALISEAVAYRLYELQNWTGDDKAAHKRNIAERDAILGSVRPGYLKAITRSRVAGGVSVQPAQWKLRLLTWLLQKL